jgi:hypothetical protein
MAGRGRSTASTPPLSLPITSFVFPFPFFAFRHKQGRWKKKIVNNLEPVEGEWMVNLGSNSTNQPEPKTRAASRVSSSF